MRGVNTELGTGVIYMTVLQRLPSLLCLQPVYGLSSIPFYIDIWYGPLQVQKRLLFSCAKPGDRHY